jgi:hypothetical protein
MPAAEGFAVAGRRAFFSANDGVSGWEPWAVHLGGIFKDGFESESTLNWSSALTGFDALSVTSAAGLGGSRFGLQGVVEGASSLFVQDDSPMDEDVFRARFRLDPTGFDPGEASGHFRARVFIVFEEAPVRRLVALVLRRRDGLYSLMARVRLDDNTHADTGFFDLGLGEHEVALEWRRATGPDALDGEFALWIDGAERSRLAGLDTHRRSVDFVRLGAMNLKGGANGTLAWDAYESRRDDWPEP